jgi:hypothetical protein
MRELESKCLLQGRKYAVQVRSAARKAFFSPPLMFNVAFPKPKKVEVRRERNNLTVTWEFPSDYCVTRFLVTVGSLHDRVKTAQVELHSCTFHVNAETLAEELNVTVCAISEDDIMSAPGTAVFISHPPSESTMSPRMETDRGTQNRPRLRDVTPPGIAERADCDRSDTSFMEDSGEDEPDNFVDCSNEPTRMREQSRYMQVC